MLNSKNNNKVCAQMELLKEDPTVVGAPEV